MPRSVNAVASRAKRSEEGRGKSKEKEGKEGRGKSKEEG